MTNSYRVGSLREFARVLFQHRLKVFFIVAIATVGTWLYCQFAAPKLYRSQVSLIFKRPSGQNVSDDTGEKSLEVFVKAQRQIVKSDLVLARTRVIAEDKNLRRAWYDVRKQWEAAREDPKSDTATVMSRVDGFLNGRPDDASSVAHRVGRLLNEQQASLGEFRNAVDVAMPDGDQAAMTESFTLIVDRPAIKGDPESYQNAKYAADILADMYMVRYQELDSRLNFPSVRVVQDALDAYTNEMQRRQERYDAFVKENAADINVLEQMLDSGGEHGGQIMVQKVRESDATLNIELARDRAVHEVLTSELPPKAFEPGGVDAMKDAEVAAALNLVSGDFLTKPAFDEVVRSLSKLETKKANLETQFQPESYEIKNVDDEIAAIKRQLFASVVGYVKSLAAGIKAREMQIVMNRQLIESRTAEQTQMHKKLVDYTRVKNEFQVAQQHLEGLVKEKMTAMTSGLRTHGAATIRKMDEASIPDIRHPVSPRPVQYTLLALAGSLLLSIILAFFLNRFDHTMHSSFDAERYLGLPVLGSVKKRGRGLVVAA